VTALATCGIRYTSGVLGFRISTVTLENISFVLLITTTKSSSGGGLGSGVVSMFESGFLSKRTTRGPSFKTLSVISGSISYISQRQIFNNEVAS